MGSRVGAMGGRSWTRRSSCELGYGRACARSKRPERDSTREPTLGGRRRGAFDRPVCATHKPRRGDKGRVSIPWPAKASASSTRGTVAVLTSLEGERAPAATARSLGSPRANPRHASTSERTYLCAYPHVFVMPRSRAQRGRPAIAIPGSPSGGEGQERVPGGGLDTACSSSRPTDDRSSPSPPSSARPLVSLARVPGWFLPRNTCGLLSLHPPTRGRVDEHDGRCCSSCTSETASTAVYTGS